ncbi:SMI1/KNR4 family protein [Macrococcoides canis]|uniref:SMI1/KNR4 family protein n=1 Tax=Macrococcoides canis TaxID=1855823 RepID=UPI001AEC445B|nr:SMI1/KNR4 family protein [Macrococcus canis]QTQ07259.1 SMI1/KNR4 family protein [Macrococcus canis]
MNFEKFDNYIEADAKLRQSDIDLFESWRGYKLPKDFVEFTLKYPGAYVEGSFDAEDRPGASINQFLKFEKSEFDSIYIDSLYEFSDFGPYVLFACDAGGNYLAFDYSKNKLNPSVVFIDHEELGVLELPEGTTENDFTEEELDRMMSSEKLEDFPWAIHYVEDSFDEFLLNLNYVENSSIEASSNPITDFAIKNLEEKIGHFLPVSYKSFLRKFGGALCQDISIVLNELIVDVLIIQHIDEKNNVNILKTIELKGGLKKFKNFIPIITVRLNKNFLDFSQIALKYNLENDIEVVIIPNNVMNESKEIKDEDIIKISDDVDSFLSLLTKELEK